MKKSRSPSTLCLACKACKSECPANVDLATYKSEFLSHYYEGKLRPLHAYAFGMIDQWAKLAAFAPRIANGLSNAPGVNQLLRKALGLAPQRQIPQFAVANFQQWARERNVPDCDGLRQDGSQESASGRREVILWADTFNNYFRPGTSQAAHEVLTSAGFNVRVPQKAFLLWQAVVRLRHARSSKRNTCSASCRFSVRKLTPEFPLLCWSQAAHRCFAMNSQIFSPKIHVQTDYGIKHFFSVSFSPRLPAISRRSFLKKCCSMVTVITSRLMKMNDEEIAASQHGCRIRDARLRLLRNGWSVRF